MPIRAAIVLTYLTLIPSCLWAQTTSVAVFSGTVTDSETGERLQGVNVYLDGSTSGSSTDSLGNYKFQTTLTGSQRLVFSFMGYQTNSRSVEVSSGDSLTFNTRLQPRTIDLKELKVIASNKEWKQNYQFFESEFIGNTDFSDQTEITNPWVLDFSKNNQMLTATAQQPLVIINRALGYKVHTELVKFEWNTSTRLGVYKAYTQFEELQPDNETEKIKWIKNRVSAYYGSKYHFYKTLYEGNLDDSHFSLRYDYNLARVSENELKSEFLSSGKGRYQLPTGVKSFRLKGRVEIMYKRILKYEIDEESITERLRKKSAIEPAKTDKLFYLKKEGVLEDPASVRVYGNWADSRMANNLPTDYSHEL